MGLQLSCESKFRRELKFSIECDSVNKILSMLRASCPTLAPIFYKRSINNIYFDTHRYSLFHQAKEGASPRSKVRLRWYGEHYSENAEANLEFKIKVGDSGTKICHKIEGFRFGEQSDLQAVIRLLNESNLPAGMVPIFKTVKPSLINTYDRIYYATYDGELRLTVDTRLLFLNADISKVCDILRLLIHSWWFSNSNLMKIFTRRKI